jgi:hypothetical protein
MNVFWRLGGKLHRVREGGGDGRGSGIVVLAWLGAEL